MSLFTSFDSQFGNDHSSGMDMSGNGMHQETVVHTGTDGTGLPHDPTIVTHMPDGLGGEYTLYDGQTAYHHQPNPFGGEDVYDHNGHLLHSSISDGTGTEGHDNTHLTNTEHGVGTVTGLEGHPLMVDQSNANQVLGYSDPLAHSGSYVMPPFYPGYDDK
jgi:hypothetical protein